MNKENTKIVYNMVDYISKMMRVENDKIKIPPIIQNGNSYPKIYKSYSNESDNVLSGYGFRCGTFLPEKSYFRSNRII